MNHDAVISEARARIIWGENCSAVSDFLSSNGLSDAEATAKVGEFRRERNAEIRRRGVRNSLIGAAILGAAGILLYLAFGGREFGGSFDGLAVAIPAGFYGIWKLTAGVICLLCPQSEDRSIEV